MRTLVFLIAATLALTATAPAHAQVFVVQGGSAPPGYYGVNAFGGLAVTPNGIRIFPAYPVPPYPPFGYPALGPPPAYPLYSPPVNGYPTPWRP